MTNFQETEEGTEETDLGLGEGASSWLEAEHEPPVNIRYYTPGEVPEREEVL